MIFDAFLLYKEHKLANKGKGKRLDKDRKFGVILEDLRTQFCAFGEGLDFIRKDISDIREEVKEIREQVGLNAQDIAIIKLSLNTMQGDISDIKGNLKEFDKRIVHLETSAK